MTTTTRKEAFFSTLEYVLDAEGKKHYVYPMKLRDLELVQGLFTEFNDEFIVMNLPAPLMDGAGNPVLNDDSEYIINTEPYDAMMQVLEKALQEPQASIETWIDLGQIEDVLAKYRRISRLLKKKTQLERDLLGMP